MEVTLPEKHADNVASQGSVGVGVFNVNHRHQLWEEDDIDQVCTQVPETIDSGDLNAHHHSQDSNSKYPHPHHPDDLSF